MKLLTDTELHEKITNGELITKGFKQSDKTCWNAKDSAIQPCSIDLHIGEIFIPQGGDKSLPKYSLKPGETVVMRSLETLHLPNNIAAIGFPPSHVSRDGILTTNPGHIDPGYRGPFHLTLINMGKKDYPLKEGDIIATLLFFELDKFSRGYMQRRNDSCKEEACPCYKIDECDDGYNKKRDKPKELEYLAPDFMDFEDRIDKKVERAVIKAGWLKELIKALVPLLAAFMAGFWGYTKINDRIKELEDVKVEEKLNDIADQIDKMQYYDQLTIKQKIAELEKKQLQQSNKDGETELGADKP